MTPTPDRCRISELDRSHRAAVVELWHRAGLTRPWNSPERDFDRAVDGATSAVLGALKDSAREQVDEPTQRGAVVATAMVGDDGHRGWIYYVAVDPDRLRGGLGATMMREAEQWLTRRGVRKIELMVRTDNDAARHFYAALGYERQDVVVLARWLDAPDES
jgi:ribosomal protein S18 acetylase RimI-like enzyme